MMVDDEMPSPDLMQNASQPPKRKKIQILKLDASQGTSGQFFETGGSIDSHPNVRMSTKLLSGDAMIRQQNQILNNIRGQETGSEGELAKLQPGATS